jgi:hypothetical protein
LAVNAAGLVRFREYLARVEANVALIEVRNALLLGTWFAGAAQPANAPHGVFEMRKDGHVLLPLIYDPPLNQPGKESKGVGKNILGLTALAVLV